jgi:MFS family permease
VRAPRALPDHDRPLRTARARLVERLAHGHDRHCQRWQLQIPCEEKPQSAVRPLLVRLAFPTFGLAFAISVLTTYGPIVLLRLTHSTSQVGALIGGEGAFALVVPLLAGRVSDRLEGSPARRRLPFVAAGAPLVATGLTLLALGRSYPVAVGAILAFFVGYYVYYPPYRALYADLLPRSLYPRAQSSQAIFRGAGLGLALLSGGVLLTVSPALPFVLAATAVLATTLALAPLLCAESSCPNKVLPYEAVSLRRLLLRNGELRAFAAANALWEFSFSGLKSFIVLYVVRGLGQSSSVASAVMAVVAATYVVGAPVAGRLGERFGTATVLRAASLVYGAGLVSGAAVHTLAPMLAALPFVALAGAIVMTLPQALAFTLAPQGSEGVVAGLLDVSRGAGVVLGPLAVGAAIEAARGRFPATHGYGAMWLVIGIPVLASVGLLRRVSVAGAAPRSSAPTARGRGVRSGQGRRRRSCRRSAPRATPPGSAP